MRVWGTGYRTVCNAMLPSILEVATFTSSQCERLPEGGQPITAVNQNLELTILILKDMVEPNLLAPSMFRTGTPDDRA